MLDDLKMIHEKDAQDALGIAEKEAAQLQLEWQIDIPVKEYCNIVFAGMGGSALYALMVQSWPGTIVPFEVCRTYDIPGYVTASTLFIASSYSGNTEETLSALDQAERKQASIVVIAGGGKLLDRAKEKGYPYIELPALSQPRFAAFAGFKATVAVLEAAQLSKLMHSSQQVSDCASWLNEAIQQWAAVIPTANNKAKQLALEAIGKSPVIYAGPKLAPAAYKWKISFNENAKNVAWWNVYPEFNHNEFIGWSSHPVDKPYAVFDLRSSLEHPQVQRRFEVSERLLSGKRPETHVVQLEGKNVLQQMLWGIALGDFVSLYTALLNGNNPTPVDLIEKFKKELV